MRVRFKTSKVNEGMISMAKIKKSTVNNLNKNVKKYVKHPVLSVVLLAIISVSTYVYNEIYIPNRQSATVMTLDYQEVKCVDGDTFKLDKQTVRLLAVDTPETVKPNTPVQPFGKDASNLTCDLITSANNIELKQDVGNEYDKYDRVLAWVYIDGELLQEKLLEKGFAEIKYVNNKTVDQSILTKLKAVEKTAQDKKLGIWK